MKNIILGIAILTSYQVYGQGICMDSRPCNHKNNKETLGHRGMFESNSTWENGSTLKVKFLNGAEYLHKKVKTYAPLWSNHANIKFQFVEEGDADIRIHFDDSDASWALVGLDAKDAAQDKETMNFGWFNEETEEVDFRRTILHEFGHALGLLHEHQNPKAAIKWNKDKVYAYYIQRQNWSKASVDKDIFGRYSVTQSNGEYDPYSIMHYPIKNEFTLNDYQVTWNNFLSARDKKVIADLYPFDKKEEGIDLLVNNVEIVHNQYNEEGERGMYVYGDFSIKNAQGQECLMGIYFYDINDNILKDNNKQYYSAGGEVMTSSKFTPKYEHTVYEKQGAFIPYEELDLKDTDCSLKLVVSFFDESWETIGKSDWIRFLLDVPQ